MKLIPEIEASARLNLPPSVLRALRRKGQAPRHILLLRKAHYDEDGLDAWAQSQMSEPSTTSTTVTTPTTTAPTAVQSKEESHD